MRKRLINAYILIAAISCLPITAFAQDKLWQSFTNMRSVRDVVSTSQGVWAATGGGVLLWNKSLQTYRKFTNTEGLRQNQTAAIASDRRGRIWIALATGTIVQPTGLIDIFDPVENTFSHIDDYKDRQIFDFLVKGDSMFIALDIGVSFYRIDREEVKETYKSLGLRLSRETAVNSLFLDGQELWAATDKGIARTSLTFPNLLAPESWTNYAAAEGLPSAIVRGFAKFAQRIVAATDNGVAAFDGQFWSNISGNIANREILQLMTSRENNNEVLYAATPVGIYRSESIGAWTLVGTNLTHVTGMIIDDAGTLWASTSGAGLYEFASNNQTWQLHEPDGPAVNGFNSLTLDDEANLWCTSSVRLDPDRIPFDGGFQIFDGTRWYNYSTKNLPSFWDDVRSVIILPNGERWFATWGRGVYVFEGEPDNLSLVAHYDAVSGHLSTAREVNDPNFPAIPFLKRDDQGNIWICNYNPVTSNPIAVRMPSDNWVYFSTNDGLRDPLVTVLEIEKTLSADRIWVGTLNHGVSVIDYNGTLTDKTDDDPTGELDLDDNLLSVRVTALAQDRDGFMWIGTDKGLNYWFGGGGANDRFCYSLISDDVKAIGVDARNNKWIGTSAGISVLSGEDNCTILAHYTVENSPLVSNFVTSFAFNPNTGDVWIGTANGISRLRTPYTAPKPDFSQLTGYPNPFLLDEERGVCGGQGGFRITNLAEDSAVKIYNIAGELVRSYPAEMVPGAQVCWDGRNESGNLVPSGVYIFVAFVESSGASGVGKVAVVRR
jgi:ligand-binding sensor domain-containing protein